MPTTPDPVTRVGSVVVFAAAVESWLTDLGLEPGERAERDGISSWDLVLDGRRRFDIRITLILDPGLALVAWAHYAPPLNDMFRKTYRRLLRWNDSFPFAKFALAPDDRPILETEIPVRWLDADELGLAIARLLAICDLLLEESAGLIWIGGRIPSGEGRISRGIGVLSRYERKLEELVGA
ncbi:MAG TPA: YbjN domain-containing protein [Candidatus Limnocylindrales bacterium]|nr:YbjN domain-containing protein [Candidatus Limnocylindrales bacterium]